MKGIDIKKIRKELKLTQEKLANKLEVSKSLVQKWETNERTPDEFYISKIIKLQNNNTVTHTKEHETGYDKKINEAEARIKELEIKLKSNDPDLTPGAVDSIKKIIEGLYEEISIRQIAKNDYLSEDF